MAQIITFYSYKGGTGRSMSMANVAWILASQRKKVLMIDWDLEAPGLHRYFSPFLVDPTLSASPGIIDFLRNFAVQSAKVQAAKTANDPERPPDWYREHADITDYALSLRWPHFRPGTLDLVPAGKQDADYATRVNSFNFDHFYSGLGGGAFLEAAKEYMEVYDYVLIDSRTGVSDTSGICTVQMPETVVICFTSRLRGNGRIAMAGRGCGFCRCRCGRIRLRRTSWRGGRITPRSGLRVFWSRWDRSIGRRWRCSMCLTTCMKRCWRRLGTGGMSPGRRSWGRMRG